MGNDRGNAEQNRVAPVTAGVGAPGTMLYYALILLVIAIMAAALGFGYLAGAAAVIAKVFFVLFLILFAITLFRSGSRFG
jgi:uncharacterized membrane protein YtjA (UPF0391 family)